MAALGAKAALLLPLHTTPTTPPSALRAASSRYILTSAPPNVSPTLSTRQSASSTTCRSLLRLLTTTNIASEHELLASYLQDPLLNLIGSDAACKAPAAFCEGRTHLCWLLSFPWQRLSPQITCHTAITTWLVTIPRTTTDKPCSRATCPTPPSLNLLNHPHNTQLKAPAAPSAPLPTLTRTGPRFQI
jgi:hypothetical protein